MLLSPRELTGFVIQSMVKAYGLTTGMSVKGWLRPPVEGERYFALGGVDEIDCHEPGDAATRSPFSTPSSSRASSSRSRQA